MYYYLIKFSSKDTKKIKKSKRKTFVNMKGSIKMFLNFLIDIRKSKQLTFCGCCEVDQNYEIKIEDNTKKVINDRTALTFS